MPLIGCCGWAGSQPRYFSQFPVIEIQSTFYDPPAANLCETCLPFRYPSGIVFAHRLLIIAEQIGDIGDGHPPLQENPRKCVPEPMWRRRFLKLAGKIKHLADLPAPHVRNDENNRPNLFEHLFEHRCQRNCPMIK
jgi:hypothetical protein